MHREEGTLDPERVCSVCVVRCGLQGVVCWTVQAWHAAGMLRACRRLLGDAWQTCIVRGRDSAGQCTSSSQPQQARAHGGANVPAALLLAVLLHTAPRQPSRFCMCEAPQTKM